jgi:hypothetical protein
MNALGEAIGDEQRRASAAHEQLNSCHALGLADRVQAAGPGSRSARVHVCSPVRQSRQVVRQGLSGQILQQGMLTRPTDTLMRQAPKILFDKPAHVIAIRQLDRRNHILSKRSHQDMGAPAGVDLVNQTDTNAGGPAARRWAIVSPSALYRAQRKPCAAPSPRVANSMPRWSSPCANQVAAPPPGPRSTRLTGAADRAAQRAYGSLSRHRGLRPPAQNAHPYAHGPFCRVSSKKSTAVD